MTDVATKDAYGVLTEPTTLTIQRFLPGPVERVWSYLTESDLRRQWLASGDMELKVGAPFTLTWRNDELTEPPGKRPEGMGKEHSMDSRVIEIDPPHKLVFAWGEKATGSVSMTLETKGERVLLTLVHRRLPERPIMLKIAAGWHSHLDLLVDRVAGKKTSEPHWDRWVRLQKDYDKRIPA